MLNVKCISASHAGAKPQLLLCTRFSEGYAANLRRIVVVAVVAVVVAV